MTIKFSIDKNPADDEHADMPNVAGVFINQWCLIGAMFLLPGQAQRMGYPDYSMQIGVIILNHFFGIYEERD